MTLPLPTPPLNSNLERRIKMGKKLYILRPIEDDELWEPWYDRAFGFVVLAEDAKEARKIASEHAGEEVKEERNKNYTERTKVINPWLEAKHSTCKELKPIGKSRLIMRDFAAA